MADMGSFSDDISALWGAPGESALEPPRPNGTVTNGRDARPAPTNGSRAAVAAADPRDHVARLADALAGHQVDVVRRTELGAMRAEMEDAFTQKLAVVLYELLTASNDRFSDVEHHVDQRLEDVSAELSQSIRAQSDRLVAAVDAQQRLTADLARSARDEMIEISDRFSAPMQTLWTFQREVRHEVGRLGDVVAAQGAEAARRAEEDAERTAKASAALAERFDGSRERDEIASESLEAISERVTAVQSALADVHEAIRALGQEVHTLRQRPGARRRRRRSR